MAARKKKPEPVPDLHVPAPVWTDSTSYSQGERSTVEPRAWTCHLYLSPIDRNSTSTWLGADRISVEIHREQSRGQPAWAMVCKDARIYHRILTSPTAEGAQREAVAAVVHRLQATAQKVAALAAILYPPTKEVP